MKKLFYFILLFIIFCVNLQAELKLKAQGGVLQFGSGVGPFNVTIPEMKNIQTFTIEGWFKMPSYTDVGYSNPIIEQNIETGNDFKLGIEPSGGLNFHVIDGNGQGVGSKCLPGSNSYTPNEWQHIAIVKDGVNQKIYVNGVQQCSLDADVSKYLTSGKFFFYAPHGEMDEIRVWDIARTASQIKDNMYKQLDGNESNLTAYYNFDEKTGNTIKDITTNHNDTIKTDDVKRLNFLGSGLSFNGSSNYISIPNKSSTALSDSTDITISAWIKTDSVSSTSRGVIFDQAAYVTGQFMVEFFTLNGYLYFAPGNHGQQWDWTIKSATQVSDGYWHYVSATKSGTLVKIYIDGKLSTTQTSTHALGGTKSTAQMTIGRLNRDANDYFKGSIAEVSLWSKVLSESEINKIMNSSPNMNDTNLLGYWPLQEGSGTTAKDYSSQANNGIITGASWQSTAPTIYGKTLYTTKGIITHENLAVENNTSIPTYSYSGTIPSEVTSFNTLTGSFFYHNNTETNTTLSFSADDNGTTLNSLFNVIVYDSNISNTKVDFNLSNVNLNDKNISAITLVGSDQNYSVTIDNISDGNNSFSTLISKDGNYSIQFTTNNDKSWYYNLNDNKMYYDKNDSESFLYNITTGSTLLFDINATLSNWANTIPAFLTQDQNFTTSISENTGTATTLINIAQYVQDSDGDSLTYSLSGKDASLFSINSSGQITFNSSPDYENPSDSDKNNIYQFDVTISDGIGSVSKGVSITVTDINENASTVTDTAMVLLRPIEQSISNSDYNGGTPQNLINNSIDGNISLYRIYENNNSTAFKPLTIEKNILSDSNAYKVAISVYPSNSIISNVSHTINDFNATNNIISLKQNNTTVATLFLKNILSTSDLQNYYNNYKNFTITFPENSNAKGYEIYKKQLVTQCSVDTNSSLAYYNTISSLDTLKHTYKYNNSTRDASDQNILVYNKYNSNKGLQLTDDGGNNVYEIDLSSGTQSSSAVGTWEELKDQPCSQNGNSFTSKSVIIFHLNTGTTGYEHIAVMKDKNNNYAQGTYIPAGDTTEEIFLNKEAVQYIATQFNINSTLTLKHTLKTDWTYLSLPSNITLCTAAYQSALTDICDQNFNIDNVFGGSGNDISIFKYRGGYWSDYTTTDKVYNMDKITSIDNTDGLLIHLSGTNTKVLYLPYNIYDLTMDTYKIYTTGWHLVGTQFTKTPATFESETQAQGKTLKYIMKQNDYQDGESLNWEVSAPTNDGEVDSSIQRIDSIPYMSGFWIFVE